MCKNDTEETRAFWNRVADDWEIQVGDEGDRNRILNSDPVLWRFAGDVDGLRVLDAGCGTGYLARKLQERGAHVVGIDFAEEMISIAKKKSPDIDFRVDSCSELATLPDDSFDMVISNYVLMDTPELKRTMDSYARVLLPGGVAIVVFSHPCFPLDYATDPSDNTVVEFRWPFPYFDRRKCVAPPWGHFTSEFIWFHRPLSDYWKAFVAAGFTVMDFEEPRITPDRYHLAKSEKSLKKSKSRPNSVAFKLQLNAAAA